MKTIYRVFRPGAASYEEHEIDWPSDPRYDRIKQLVEPLLGDREPLEHVSVLYEDRPTDMFVSELGWVELATRPPLQFNRLATDIYQANWMTHYPADDPEKLPEIAGTAVVFTRRVWF